MKKYDVTALGELLIDFTENGTDERGNPLYAANPGGAPCNVLAMLSMLGKKTAFIGKVGRDSHGDFLEEAAKGAGIDTSGLVRDGSVHTTLSFVHTFPDGDREFSFYRNPGADMMLGAEDIDESLIKGASVFHFGTLSMTHAGVREATIKAIDIAKSNGCALSFDPNLRPPLWDDLSDARGQMEAGMALCDILKIADNEVTFLTGEENVRKGAELLREKWDIPLMMVTLGADGSFAFCGDAEAAHGGYKVDTIETTGAGDAFMGAALSFLIEKKKLLRTLDKEELGEMLSFANAAAAIVTTRRGAIRSMPGLSEIKKLMKENA